MPDYKDMARAAARKYGLNPDMFVAQIGQESGWNPNIRSSAGAGGLAQIMPGTAKGLGISDADRFNPEIALDAGARYMRQMLDKFGNEDLARMAYNAGPGRVQKWLDGKGSPLNAETLNYNALIYKRAGVTPSELVSNLHPSKAPTEALAKAPTQAPTQAPAGIVAQAPTQPPTGVSPHRPLSIPDLNVLAQATNAAVDAGIPFNPEPMPDPMAAIKMLAGPEVRQTRAEPHTVFGSLDNMRSQAQAAQDETMALLFGSNNSRRTQGVPRQVDQYIDNLLG